MAISGEQVITDGFPNGPRAVVLEEISLDPMMELADEDDRQTSEEEQFNKYSSEDSSPEPFEIPSLTSYSPVITLSICPDEFDDIGAWKNAVFPNWY